MTSAIRSQLILGVEQLALNLSETKISQLCAYLDLLIKWNKAYNLTAITNPVEMVGLHILDSLAIGNQITGKTFIDVGTGAGLPGLVLAMQNPQLEMTLLDSNGKKTRFLNQAKTELRLTNVEVVHSRVEDYAPAQLFDGILSRAFASLKDMTDNAAHLLAEGGRFWAMKGRYPEQELNELDSAFALQSARTLEIPNVAAERHLIELSMAAL